MTTINMFEYATRNTLRFPSVKGDLTVEQLWALPLTSKTGFDLDTVARSINQLVKENSEESFVVRSNNALKEKFEISLEIVKHIISVRIAESEAATLRSKKKAERERLLEILNQKEEQNLLNMSTEEIRKRIEELAD